MVPRRDSKERVTELENGTSSAEGSCRGSSDLVGQRQERAERAAWKVLPRCSRSVVAVIGWFLFALLPTPLLRMRGAEGCRKPLPHCSP